VEIKRRNYRKIKILSRKSHVSSDISAVMYQNYGEVTICRVRRISNLFHRELFWKVAAYAAISANLC